MNLLNGLLLVFFFIVTLPSCYVALNGLSFPFYRDGNFAHQEKSSNNCLDLITLIIKWNHPIFAQNIFSLIISEFEYVKIEGTTCRVDFFNSSLTFNPMVYHLDDVTKECSKIRDCKGVFDNRDSTCKHYAVERMFRLCLIGEYSNTSTLPISGCSVYHKIGKLLLPD